MPAVRVRMVTIISRQIAEERIVEALARLGAHGFTAIRASGHGHHGPLDAGFASSGNEVFQVLASAATAERILAWVEGELSDVHPAIAYAIDVDAVPGDRFRDP